MCGISGGIGTSAPTKQLLGSQLKSLEHRGPDDIGIFIDVGISLGMCRLAIVEIAEGRQPAGDHSKCIQIVWNGEIYNYKDLRHELEKHGIFCRNTSESEVLIQLYLKFGLKFVEKLNGMFAIAIYDGRVNSLHLIRDRIGKKPLWISLMKDGTLLFASQVRALMIARPDRTLRTSMISEVLQFGYISAPNSTFNEISQIPPGSIMSWSAGKISVHSYWAPRFEPKINMSYELALEKTQALIQEAVSRRLVSERPLGSFLSGGYDSTVVTAYMARLMSKPVQTFSIGFTSPLFDESNHARRIADFLGTDHHEEILSPNPSLLVEEISQILDQPFADSSIIPTYLLAKFARKNVIVALGGDGGDEIFGGYDRYLATPLLHKLNPVLGLAKFGLSLIDKRVLGNGRKINRASSQLKSKSSMAHRFASIQSLVQPENLQILLSPDFNSLEANHKFVESFEVGKLDYFDRMIKSDLSYFLPGDILFKSDIASMANSLELRSPLLDVNIIEWGLLLPRRFKVKGLETKHILKDIARSLVPPELIDRPKMGFGIPRAEWLRTGLKELMLDTLMDATTTQRGWFNSSELKKIIDAHMAGEDKDSQIWPILMLELWARTWLD